MANKKQTSKLTGNPYLLEHRADLLKERIYTTIILLAVLAGVDVKHSDPVKAFLIVIGTILSIWAASIVADGMARRIILRQTAMKPDEVGHRLREHSPILAAAILPTISFTLSIAGMISLSLAVNLTMGYCLLLMIIWSVFSARAIGAKGPMIIVATAIELVIGVSVVLMKVMLGH